LALGRGRLHSFPGGLGALMKSLYAILIDGGFITKKLQQRLARHVTAEDICLECERLQALPLVQDYELLRIYFYDAAPLSATVTTPVAHAQTNLSVTERARAAQSLHANLVLKPYFALRMGQLHLSPDKWRMKPRAARNLRQAPRPLVDEDFVLDIKQAGVDMRIGLDMARLALRDMVRAVIVVTGDSDFVPAFKFVRREGVKVILEPMGHNVRPEMRQHADIVIEPPVPAEPMERGRP